MVCRTAIALAALVVSVLPASAKQEHAVTLRWTSLPAGQHLRIRTAERQYRVQLVNPATGEALVAGSLDGQQFSPPEKMFLLGASHVPQPEDGGFAIVLMGELREGLCIEWGRGSLAPENRGTTSPVRSLTLSDPD